MKTLLLTAGLFALAGTTAVQAQITLETQYPHRVNAFKLSTGEIKYATYVEGATNQVRVYNQNHSLLRQITVPLSATSRGDIKYLSDRLFNNTPGLEFLIYHSTPTSAYKATVFDENSTTLLALDSTSFVDIYNSAAGTKMITYHLRPVTAGVYGVSYSKVYSLGGTLAPLRTRTDNTTESQAFPNPTSERIRIPYTVPGGQVGALTITDALGRTVATYQVDPVFDHLLLDTRSYRPGVYLYQVAVNGVVGQSHRFVVER